MAQTIGCKRRTEVIKLHVCVCVCVWNKRKNKCNGYSKSVMKKRISTYFETNGNSCMKEKHGC